MSTRRGTRIDGGSAKRRGRGRDGGEGSFSGVNAFPDERDLVCFALSVVMMLTTPSPDVTVPACQVVVEAMLAFPADDEIRRLGCVALKQMSTAVDARQARDALEKAGACKAVLGALKACAAEVEPLQCAKALLTFPDSADKLMGGRICDLVLEILQTHPEDRAVFKAGVACIKNPHADKWMEVGVAEVMVAGLQRFAADQEVCRVGAFAVWGLAYGSAASNRLLEAGVCKPIVKMIETFAGDAVLVRRGRGGHASRQL